MDGIIVGIFTEGMIFGIMALGIYISYKILDFPDLSVDGTFPLGAAVTTALITAGINPWLSLLVSFLAGALAGTVTGLLHVKLHIKNLLSGILMMTLLYSVNYRIVGKPNAFLIDQSTIFSSVEALLENIPIAANLSSSYVKLIVVIIIALFAKYVLDWYLRTKSGFLLKSVGDNEALVVTLAQNPGKIKIIGLAIGNGLVALSGAVACQSTKMFNVSDGTGKLVMGLAAVIIGTTVLKKLPVARVTSKVLMGMIVYKACISIALSLGFEAYDLNMIVTILFVLTLVLNDLTSRKKRGGTNA